MKRGTKSISILTRSSGIVIASPTELSNLEAWFESTNTDFLTLSTNDVVEWADQSSFGRNANVGASPEYNSTTINSNLTVDFSPAGLDHLFCNETDKVLTYGNANLAGGYTVFSVFEVNAVATDNGTTPGQNATLYSPTGANMGLFFRDESGTINARVWHTPSGHSISPPITISVATTIIAVQTYDGTTLGLSINGSAPVTVAALEPSTDTTTYWIGKSSGASSYFDGHMGEIIMYSKLLSTAEKAAVINYLNGKWT